jgi:hypothetical protein
MNGHSPMVVAAGWTATAYRCAVGGNAGRLRGPRRPARALLVAAGVLVLMTGCGHHCLLSLHRGAPGNV